MPSFPKIATTLLMLNPLAKGTQVQFGIPQPQQSLSALPPLPPECKDFDLIKGDPFKAKTLILGEAHQICDKTRYLCTQGLLAAKLPKESKGVIDPNTVIALFEEYDLTQQAICDEVEGFDNKMSNDCRGWNHEKSQQGTLAFWRAKTLGTLRDEIGKEFGKWLSEPKETQQFKKSSYIKKSIDPNKKEITNLEKRYDLFMKKHAKSKPNLFTRLSINLEIARFKQQQLNKISTMIKEGKHSVEILRYIKNEEDKHINSYAKHREENDALKTPNEAMLKAISNANKPNKVTVVYAGDTHINKDSDGAGLYSEKDKGGHAKGLTKEQKKNIQELYDGLDKFADENPYAVLSCKLG